ncbi:hypothetical protein ACFWQC_02990 [Nocardioides sp. NPDC058538]|uniref:hypothetical protein n=1 Tax=Nocardioides sp. NPDC058538 TaxID=3346542 RepID=UPI00364A62C2
MFGRLNERAAAEWSRFTNRAAQLGLSIVTVVDVYQYAQTGTKALVNLYGEAESRDAWFWWEHVDPGMTLAVALSTGYGPHTHRDGVIYVGSEQNGSGVYDAVTAKTVVRAQRHQLRAAAKASGSGTPSRTTLATPTSSSR